MPELGELTAAGVTDFLVAAGLLEEAALVTVEELGGGISNVVLRVSAPELCLVVKQSRPKLRVRADWPFDQRGTLVERDCLTLLGRLVPGAVPEMLQCDEASFTLVMSCVSPGGVLWKDDLLRRRVDPAVAGRAGELLGRTHRLAAGDAAARERFADQSVLVQGRTDPYHVAAAALHPELAPTIEAEVERMLATQRTLTLGDYSPKNIFVYPDSVVAIDFEVAHWGDPGFDVAFSLTHLGLKAVRFGELADRHLAGAHRFWQEYRSQGADELCDEEGLVRELGCLLLARIDGKSPVEYVEDERTKDAVRALAARLIAGPRRTVPEALQTVAGSISVRRRERVPRRV
jgi:5-methylthioribose kinase